MNKIFSYMCGLLLFLGAAFPALAQDAIAPSKITQLVLLGVGNPNPLPERSGPASALIVNGVAYMVDFGPGVIRRARMAQNSHHLEALDAKNIRFAFLTHLHHDHSAGLPDLLLTGWTMGRDVPLELFGPPGTKAMAAHIIKAYEKDIDVRVKGLEPTNDQGWRVNAHEGTTGLIYRDENITVEAFKVCHGDMENSLGYRFTTPDRVIVFSGDTAPCPIMAEMAKGADILVHEVYSAASYKKLPPEWAAYHAAFHSSSIELAKIATVAQPKLLVLNHQLVWAGTPYDAPFNELKKLYDGAIADGHDLDLF